jgi:hypothetical protein
MHYRWLTAASAGLALGGALIMQLAGPGAAASAAPARAPQRHAEITGPPGGPVPPGFRPLSVTFASASDGWVLGTAPCTKKPCTSVVRTENGGRSWRGIPAPKVGLSPVPGGRGLGKLRFADVRDGFAYGSQLQVTHNGGATWHRVGLPGPVGDLEASGGVVYAAANLAGGRVSIYRSAASGNHWSRVAGLPARVRGFADPGAITLHGKSAWIFLGSHLYASKTGRRWSARPLPCPHRFGLGSLAAYSGQRLALLCAGEPGLGSTTKTIFRSDSGGASFRRVGHAPRAGDGGVLALPGPRHLFIATASGATWIYASSDGGRRWHNSLALDDGGKGWADFGFTTAAQGVAIEGVPSLGSHLYLTRNSGASWARVRF